MTELLESTPRAGIDYPATWQAFEAWFPDDEACRGYLARLRWPEGFRCPACRSHESWETTRALWMCRGCGRQTSVTAGTIFHRTRYPLRTWFAAAWFVCSQKTGASALGLKRVLGFGSYETAWTWMHKLRRAMVRPDRDQLGGPGVAVELDQAFVGGRSQGGRRARYETKAEVTIAVERRHPKGLGRVRMRRIIRDRKDEIFDFATEMIAPGTVLYTDGDRLYNDLPDVLHITHERIVISAAADPAHVLRAFTEWPRCSSAGSLAPFTTVSPPPISTTIWMSSPSASIAGPVAAEDCSSTGSSSRLQTPTPIRFRSSSGLSPTTWSGDWS